MATTRRRSGGTGNGDTCPVTPDHGAMVVLQTGTQYCPSQEHDGRPKTHRLGATGPTRKLWPSGYRSFEEAVAAYNDPASKAAVKPSALPELDITLEV